MLSQVTPQQVTGDLSYTTSLEEAVWAAILIAITMSMHGVGMILTLRMSTAFKLRLGRFKPFAVGLSSIILASWLIVSVHLAEVMTWAAFFLWTGGMPNRSTSAYFSLLAYTTLGSDLHLPVRWHMLEGAIAMAGVLTFAWSTGVLAILARDLQDSQMQSVERRRQKRSARKVDAPADDTVSRT